MEMVLLPHGCNAPAADVIGLRRFFREIQDPDTLDLDVIEQAARVGAKPIAGIYKVRTLHLLRVVLRDEKATLEFSFPTQQERDAEFNRITEYLNL